jgi:ATP-binding cassette subfamily B protein
MLADLAATARLVWSASPGLFSLILALGIVLALVPAASLWVGKLLLDAVARAISGGFPNAADAYRRLASLLALQVGIAIGASLVQTLYATARELLGDTLQNRISLRILHKAAALDVESFENAETYDALRNAYNEVGSRPLGVMFQVIGIGQALITLTTIGSLMARLGWEVLPLVLLASVPGVVVSSRFGAEGYRVMRRRATDARHQNYIGSILTSDSLVKEVRLFGFERYLLEGWQEYYKKFRAQFVSLLARRSAWGLVATLGSSLLIALATLSVLRRAASGTITVGDFSLFVGGIVQIQSQFTGLLNSVTGIYESLLYMRNLFEFLELPSRDLNDGRGMARADRFDRVPGRRLPLSPHRTRRPVGRVVPDHERTSPGARGRKRRRQDDGRQTAHSPVRADSRAHSPERRRCTPLQPAQRSARNEHHLSGLRPVSDDGAREHWTEPHRQTGRDGGD